METGKPSLTPPPIAAQIPQAAPETAAPVTRFMPTPPETAAPVARVLPTPPETTAPVTRVMPPPEIPPVTRVEPTPPKVPKTSEGRRLQSAPAAAPAQPAAIVAPMRPPSAEVQAEPPKSGPSESAPSPAAAPLRQSKPGDTVGVEMSHYGANLKLSFP